ncbi:ATP-dependent DNA helicase II subunit 1 [Golovinomyces cichoracearum]|uniref:ATP-dependent DNA helicase II subunit 1 n=1 Tax=Golovinomyces cichoracearum TaxID=62708 RepID=A0A420IN97_9PEZI|nr:ATP-dependent DNA helicase II subunit 1 [Golovinomyces cichoracearum]
MTEYKSWVSEEGFEEDEEDTEYANYVSQKDAILFAIEVRDSMMNQGTGTHAAVLNSLKLIYQIMQQQIISRPKDMIGVLLFGTQKSKLYDDDRKNYNGYEFPSCYLLVDLNIPSAEDVKLLKSLAMGWDENPEIFLPSKQGVPLSNMLLCANQIFTSRAQQYGSKRIFIITDNDDPYRLEKSIRSQATVRAKDLYDFGVILELFPISHSDNQFDHSKFYDDIIYGDLNERINRISILSPSESKLECETDGLTLLHGLISDITSKNVARQAVFSGLSFEIGPSFQISVNGYNLFKRQKPARSCWVYDGGEELKIATAEGGMITEDTAMPVESSDIRRAYQFGGSQIYFTSQEEKTLKFFGSPILRIIGFKLQDQISIWESISSSTFIYPNEEKIIGSTRVFSALWQKLLASKKVGIAWYMPRVNAIPALVAIIPSEKLLNSSGKQIAPAGLWIYTLPYSDDLRSIPPCPSPISTSDALVDQMRTIVQQLQLPGGIYDPFKYPNPTLQWHYRILQAMALGEDVVDIEPEDKTNPRYRQIQKRAGSHIMKWNVMLNEQVRHWQNITYNGIEKTNIKRSIDNDLSSSIICKKLKQDGGKQSDLRDQNQADMKDLIRSGKLNDFKLNEIKEWAKLNGVSTAGKKADLLERISRWTEKS